MRYFYHQVVVRVLDRVQARLIRSRSGSVLILVVVLVVLLALMGTALLSTTRGDRYVAAQHSVNTQIDLIVEGVKEIARAAIAGDQYDAAHRFRPAWDSGAVAAPTYANWDMPDLEYSAAASGKPKDGWLSPRLPTAIDDGSNLTSAFPAVYWPSITMLPGATEFDSPMACGVGADPLSPNVPPDQRHVNPLLRTSYITRVSKDTLQLAPSYVQPNGYSEKFPAWFFPAVSGDPYNVAPRFVLAADADGDGIADAGYVKAPFGEIDGITYYYAVRTIDNGSAINVNTAWSRTGDFKFPGSGAVVLSDAFGGNHDPSRNNLGMFRSHVGLIELLAPSATNSNKQLEELEALNKARFNDPGAGFAASATITGDATPATPRNDFTFVTQGDFLEHQLARRTDNPANYTKSNNAISALRPFGLNESGALVYHFVQIDPRNAKSSLDIAFEKSNPSPTSFDSLYRSAPTYPDKNKDNKSPARGTPANKYPADAVGAWFYDNFNFTPLTQNKPFGLAPPSSPNKYTATYLTDFRSPIRSILTSYNPVSNQVPIRLMNGALPATTPLMPVYGTLAGSTRPNPPKTNINTASFEELWRAFWSVMTEGDAGLSPFSTGSDTGAGMKWGPNSNVFTSVIEQNDKRMFRSSTRDEGATNLIPEVDMVQLRSAAAAVQAMQMREVAQPGGASAVKVPYFKPITTSGGKTAQVFGTVPQLFITEIFVMIDTQAPNLGGGNKNSGPYLAIELFNPFAQPVDITPAWKIKYWTREQGSPGKSLTDSGITLPNYTVPAGSYVLLDNFGIVQSTLKGVSFYPASSGLPKGNMSQGQGYFSYPELTSVIGKEMVITRELTNREGLLGEQPIDSYDFSGFDWESFDAGMEGRAWHYTRKTVDSTGKNGDGRWLCVYPGRYDTSDARGQLPDNPRQQGTATSVWTAGGADSVPPGAPVTLGVGSADAQNTASNIPSDFLIPLPDEGSPGPNPLSGPLASATKKFPFGMFARNGDILQVPFIASYSILESGLPVEMNSISMDAAYAEDTDDRDDPKPTALSEQHEQIGHFCPIRIGDSASELTASIVDDFDDDPATGPAKHRYAWARDLFDYLTVQSPASDYLPNVSPDAYKAASLSPRPDPVANSTLGAAEQEGLVQDVSTTVTTTNKPGIEDSTPIQGLININSAPWPVLSAIPWVPALSNKIAFNTFTGELTTAANQNGASPSPGDVDDNIDIAKAIAYWRDKTTNNKLNGPFRSPFDLYRIVLSIDGTDQNLMRYLQTKFNNGGSDDGKPTEADGDFTHPQTAAQDLTRHDFEEQYSMMTKVSNLLTTRSDSFTVYILVEGWRGVGTDHPERVVQRRVAFIQDRSTVTATNPTLPAAVNVPND